jgi:DNA-binding NtrC family response regulator
VVATAPAAASAPEDLGLTAIADRARQEAERRAIERALTMTRWRRTEAARLLKVSYRTLLRKMREYDLG